MATHNCVRSTEMARVLAIDAVNQFYGFRYLPDRFFRHVLGLGSGYGTELLPIAARLERVTIVEASDKYHEGLLSSRTEVRHLKASVLGKIDLPSNSADLVIAFSVLHHIPNVSYVLSELHRCLMPGGYAVIREPISSMGDWRKPRPGLTKRERGLPRAWCETTFHRIGFSVGTSHPCLFPGLPGLWPRERHVWNSSIAVRVDSFLCRMLQVNSRYHRTSLLHKIAPAAWFWVLRKNG
jgi:SAM-dependent methyltransferase